MAELRTCSMKQKLKHTSAWNELTPIFCSASFSRYVVVYFSILYIRYHAGIVTDEMLSLPKAPYLAVGLLEALSSASGMAAAGNVILLLISFGYGYLLELLRSLS